MASKKPRYYSLKNILKEESAYNVILGERANGKSYEVKGHCIKDAYNNGNEFIYLRRYELEIKAVDVESYFADSPINEYTSGEYETVSVWRKGIYLANYDGDNKIVRGKRIGYCMALSASTHYKSTQYPFVKNMIFEEFVTDGLYLQNECNLLMQLVSTVFRNRKDGKVFLIGNTISRVCPYFYEWELRGIPKQKQGTIENYYHTFDDTEIKISVEFAEQSNIKNTMFFGKSAEQIVTGAWKSESHPHLQKEYDKYKKLYEVRYIYKDFDFIMELLRDNKVMILFIHPNTKHRDCKRIVSNVYSPNPLVTSNLTVITNGDKIIIDLFNNQKAVYSDNLTGSDFIQIIKQKGGL